MRSTGKWLFAFAMWLLLIVLLYGCIANFAFDVSVYAQQPPFDDMAKETVAYLSGKAPSLSPSLFGEQERLHMADVLMLFQAGRMIAVGSGIGAAICLLLAFLLKSSPDDLRRGSLLGLMFFAAPLLAMALWAAIDFTGWFTMMHRLVFTNDLWMFDGSSLLIQMMPESFFSGAVARILGGMLLCTAVLTTVAQLLAFCWKRLLSKTT